MKLTLATALLALARAQADGSNTCDKDNFNCDQDSYCVSATHTYEGSQPNFSCSIYWIDFATQQMLWGSGYKLGLWHTEGLAQNVIDALGPDYKQYVMDAKLDEAVVNYPEDHKMDDDEDEEMMFQGLIDEVGSLIEEAEDKDPEDWIKTVEDIIEWNSGATALGASFALASVALSL